MRIRGEVLDVDGEPAQDPSILVSIRNNNSSEPVEVTLEGHRFEVWLPVFNIVHDNTPVANADLNVRTSDGAVLHYQCDNAGSVQIKLLTAERIECFTAWTDQPLFGGFQFSREPVRDESASTQQIELFSCREQKF